MFSVDLKEDLLNILIKDTNITLKIDWETRQILNFSFSQKAEAVSPIAILQEELPEELPKIKREHKTERLVSQQKVERNNYNNEPIEVITERLLQYIKSKGGKCPLYANPGSNYSDTSMNEYNQLQNYMKCASKKIKIALNILIEEKKVTVINQGFGRPNLYQLNLEEPEENEEDEIIKKNWKNLKK